MIWRRNFGALSEGFHNCPPIAFNAEWQKQVARSIGLRPNSFYGSLIDVDGEPLLAHLLLLCNIAMEHRQPILFQ